MGGKEKLGQVSEPARSCHPWVYTNISLVLNGLLALGKGYQASLSTAPKKTATNARIFASTNSEWFQCGRRTWMSSWQCWCWWMSGNNASWPDGADASVRGNQVSACVCTGNYRRIQCCSVTAQKSAGNKDVGSIAVGHLCSGVEPCLWRLWSGWWRWSWICARVASPPGGGYSMMVGEHGGGLISSATGPVGANSDLARVEIRSCICNSSQRW